MKFDFVLAHVIQRYNALMLKAKLFQFPSPPMGKMCENLWQRPYETGNAKEMRRIRTSHRDDGTTH